MQTQRAGTKRCQIDDAACPVIAQTPLHFPVQWRPVGGVSLGKPPKGPPELAFNRSRRPNRPGTEAWTRSRWSRSTSPIGGVTTITAESLNVQHGQIPFRIQMPYSSICSYTDERLRRGTISGHVAWVLCASLDSITSPSPFPSHSPCQGGSHPTSSQCHVQIAMWRCQDGRMGDEPRC